MRELYELFNTETGAIEAVQLMTAVEASERNFELRENQEPKKWVPYRDDSYEEW